MNWLNPTLVYFAALALVPILLHLLFRQRVQKVAFSAVRFLRKHSRELVSRKNWLEWLVTALRVVCLVLLAIAFARPFFGAHAAAGASGRETVILLDTSRSMSYGSRFSDAQNEALKIINAADAGSAITLETFADTGTAAVTEFAGAAEAIAQIKRLAPNGGGTDILAALNTVVQRAAAAHGSGDVHLISDLQATGLAKNREMRRLPKGYHFHVHSVAGAAGANAANSISVEGGAFSTDLTPGDQNFTVSTRVYNRGTAREVEVKALVSGKAMTSKRVLLPQNGDTVVTLTGTLRELGEHAGEVVVTGAPVALKGDDRFYFVVRVVNKLAVAVLDGQPSKTPAQDAAYYLVHALNAGADSPFDAKVIEKLPPLDGLDAVILSEVSTLPPDDLKHLSEFVNRGGALMIGAGSKIDPAAFNATIGTLAPARLRQWVNAAQDTFLMAADSHHALAVRLVSEGKGDLGTARFKGYWELKDSQDAAPVLRFNDGRLALVEAHVGRGSAMLFCSSLDMLAGDLPLRAIFVPFIRESMRLLCARGDQSRALAVGETLNLPSGSTLTRPDGTIQKSEGAQPTSTIVSEPGIYTLATGNVQERYAVNGDPRESDLTAADAASVEKMIDSAPETQLRRSGNTLERVVQPADLSAAESRSNFGWWCLVALLVLGVCELCLAQVASKQ